MGAIMSANSMARAAQRPWNTALRAGAFLLATLIPPDVALAYRPFDGTDAAVAEPGEMEIEFQPAGVLSSNGQRTLVAPATVLNFGMAKNWEAVFEGRFETPLDTSGPTSLTDAGAFLKNVLRPGVLQDQAGPSIATEFGALLPDSIGNSRIRRQRRRNHFTTVGLGHCSLKYRRRAHARPTRRPFHGHYPRGTVTSGWSGPLLNFFTRKNLAKHIRSRLSLARYGK